MKEREIQFHIKCGPGDVGGYCILTGDPGRCAGIAAHFDDAAFVGTNREFTVYTGTLLAEKASVVSTGIGGPSASIAMEELANLGVHTFIRVGTCGGIAENVTAGDLVVASGAVRMEGTSREYAPPEFPAVPDFRVTSALVDAAQASASAFHIGIVHCKDSFYGQHSPEKMPVSYELKNKWKAWKQLGVLASEMESAALFTVAASRGLRCGTVLHVIWNQELEKRAAFTEKPDLMKEANVPEESYDISDAVSVAVEALRRLIREDRTAAKQS